MVIGYNSITFNWHIGKWGMVIVLLRRVMLSFFFSKFLRSRNLNTDWNYFLVMCVSRDSFSFIRFSFRRKYSLTKFGHNVFWISLPLSCVGSEEMNGKRAEFFKRYWFLNVRVHYRNFSYSFYFMFIFSLQVPISVELCNSFYSCVE